MGFKGSGKDTAAAALLDRGYKKYAFADPVKDVLAAMFGWSRAMLEGDTGESRAWREFEDAWWSEKLNRPGFTPRKAMQMIGTDVLRQYFNDQIWILNTERRILNDQTDRVVITDCRFPNEAAMIRNMGGKLIRVAKGPEPEFYQYSSIPASHPYYGQAQDILRLNYGDIHVSEWAWNNIPVDARIENDGTIDDLHAKVLKAAGL